MYELSIKGDFAAAHFIEGHEGKCKNLHGHTWKVEVAIISDQLNDIGIVADFAILKKQLRETLEKIDHICLNELSYFKEVTPTAENIAKYIYWNFKKVIEPLTIKHVQVWESDTSSVTYYE